MWRELVERVGTTYLFAEPADVADLNDLEMVLDTALPPDLRALLLESDGIGDDTGVGIMSAGDILRHNVEMREFDAEGDDLYAPFANILFFAAAGNGDLFGFPTAGGTEVLHWNHETDERQVVAADLQQFVELWYSGQMQV